MAVPGGARVVVEYRNTSQPDEVAYNVLHFRTTAGTQFTDNQRGTLLGLVELATSGGFAAAVRPVMRSNGYIAALRFYDLHFDPPDLTEERVFASNALNGTVTTGSTLPPSVAWGVSLRTAVPGRRRRGRFFVPYIADSQLLVGGLFSDSLAQNFANRVEAFRALVVSTLVSVNWAVFSRVDNQMRSITNVRVGVIPDTIRRRRNRLGEAYKTGI